MDAGLFGPVTAPHCRRRGLCIIVFTSERVERLFAAGPGAQHSAQAEEDDHSHCENNNIERVKDLIHSVCQFLSLVGVPAAMTPANGLYTVI